MSEMEQPLLRVSNLGINFRLEGGTVFEAVKDISFDVPKNSTVALVGESGSGKSVSAMAVMRLLPKESAVVSAASEIHFEGSNLLKLSDEAIRAVRGKDISVIFQEPMSSLNPVFPVGDQIAEILC
ncbi:MAG: ATP-binding cassette domain-containing protein, partial [Rhodocyclaceae bacterium]